MLYTYKDQRRRRISPTSVFAAFITGILLIGALLPVGRAFLDSVQNKILSLGPTRESYLAINTSNKSDFEAEPDKDSNIVFNEKVPDQSSILVKVKPNTPGNYLFVGDLCVAQVATGQGLSHLAQSGDVAVLSDIGNFDYYVNCDKPSGSDLYSFKLLYLYSPDSLEQGIGGSGLDVSGQSGALTIPGLSTGGRGGNLSSPSQSQPQINNNFSPSNTFSPTNVYNPPAPAPSSEPDPVMDAINNIVPPIVP